MTTRRRAMLFGSALLLGSVLLTGGSAPAQNNPAVDGKLPLIGSGGGNPFTRMCPSGQVLTGLRYRRGAVIDGLGIKCTAVGRSGNLGAEVSVGTMVGGNGGTPGSDGCLQQGTNISVIASQYGGSAGFGIADLGFLCKQWFPASRTWGVANRWMFKVRSGTVFTSSADCPQGEWPAIGIYGRHGSIVDAVGLVCGPVAPS